MSEHNTSESAQQERRGRGRPRLEEPLSVVSTRLPVAYHDRLVELAKRNEMSISAAVRQLLILRLP